MKSTCFFLVCFSIQSYAQNFSSFVNPFIGTGGHGHTFPGASMPFGFCQLSPDTRIDGSWDGCGGYHYSDSLLYGFSHTHLSGTGCSDYGDILVMPTSKEVSMQAYDYASSFSHSQEKATAGFYEVFLNKWNIKAQLTVTPRVGIHSYQFPKGGDAYIVLDLQHRDEVLDSKLEIVNDSTLRGFRYSKAWATNQKIFFYIQFSKPFKEHRFAAKQVQASQTTPISFEKQRHALFVFDNSNSPILVKVAISGVDEAGAERNMEAEASHWYFEKYKQEAEKAWDKELSKIQVQGNTKEVKTIFYTALYHCMLSPNIYNDVDHRYRGRDDQVHTTHGAFDYYTVFSLWDTYRALHPLLTILDHKRTNDFVQTFLKQFEEGGRLPIWELSGNETNCMIGYHAVSVMLDAYVKGIRKYNVQKAFTAMKAAIETSKFGIQSFHRKGYLSMEDESESVSKTLEYSYNDWCIAEMARLLGKKKEQHYFDRTSKAWQHVLDVTTGCMRPRTNGGWLTPFDPYQVNNHYTEANSWQYSFAPQHHLDYLHIKSPIIKQLDALFSASTKTSGREQSDISGLIGQYAHGNEPSHHIAYLYSYVDYMNPVYQQKTIALTQQIMNDFYKNDPDGLIGNEDCGQMSAWFVLSAMGFYPVCPGKPYYSLALPLFDKITVQGDQNFTIQNKVQNKQKGIIVHTKNAFGALNKLDHFLLNDHREIIFENGDLSSESPKRKSKLSTTYITKTFPGSPILQQGQVVFDDSLLISFLDAPLGFQIRYTTNGSNPSANTRLYTKPFFIRANAQIKAAYFGKHASNDLMSISEGSFFKRPNKYTVKLLSTYNKQYTAGGDNGIIDGLYGDTDWRKGRWQGFQSQDFEAIVYLNETKSVQQVSANFLQDQRSWIFYPLEVSFFYSDDEENWSLLERIPLNKSTRDDDRNTTFKVVCTKPCKAKYIKAIAANYGKLPTWHPGVGGDAFIFIDEIEVQ